MRVYKQKYTRKGKAGTSSKWYVRFKDHTGTWRQLPGFKDKGLSESLLKKCERLAGFRANRDPLDDDMRRWLDGLADQTRERLAEWWLVDQRQTLGVLPLSDHVEAWHDSIIANGRTSNHAEQHMARVLRIVEGCNVARFVDIDPLRVKDWLSGQTLSDESRNHMIRAIRQFTRWMVDHGRAASNPLVQLKLLPVKDRRVYRSLTSDELHDLLKTTEEQRVRGGMAGSERVLLYWLAAETMYRTSSIKRLTVADFDLDRTTPKVTARKTKNGKTVSNTISLELAAALRSYFENKLPTARAIKVPAKASEIIKLDAEAAGIPLETSDGEVVFYSLRCTGATRLDEQGASPGVISARLGHKTKSMVWRYIKPDQARVDAAIPEVRA